MSYESRPRVLGFSCQNYFGSKLLSLTFSNICFYLYISGFFCWYVCLCTIIILGVLRGQKRVPVLLELELQMGMQARSSGRAAGTLNHWAISPAQRFYSCGLFILFYFFERRKTTSCKLVATFLWLWSLLSLPLGKPFPYFPIASWRE